MIIWSRHVPGVFCVVGLPMQFWVFKRSCFIFRLFLFALLTLCLMS
jgi:hypothetical protein